MPSSERFSSSTLWASRRFCDGAVALAQVGVLIAAAAVAEQRVVAGVVERHPPDVVAVRAGVEGEAA